MLVLLARVLGSAQAGDLPVVILFSFFFFFFFLCFWGGEVGRFGFLVVRSICQKAGFLYIAKKNVFFNFICGSLAK